MAKAMLAAFVFAGLSFLGPPALPPDIGDLGPDQDVAAPEPEPPEPSEEVEAPEVEAPEVEAPEVEAPEVEAPEVEASEVEAPEEEEPIPVTPEPAPLEPSPSLEPAAPEPVAPSQPAPPVQAPSSNPAASSTVPTGDSTGVSASAAVEPEPEPEPAPEPETYRKLGGTRLFRIGVGSRLGYTHGTSAKNGLYDRDKSIQSSVDNMMLTPSGAGDLGETSFGGLAYGFILDAEIIGINVWLDFHKFFKPGGMWSLLLGYDHEFGFGKRVRLDVGVGGGLNHVFLGKALSSLYYDQSNPESVNIGTLGVEARGMADLHIKLVGPLFTGPYVLLGYHYLWSANAAEVTAEKGLHYSAGWSVRLDFAAPKLIGGKRTKQR